jgi:hypothetical protein
MEELCMFSGMTNFQPTQGKDEKIPDVQESVPDAVDFFGHRHSKEQSLEHDLKSCEIPKSKAKKKLKDGGGDEDRKKKINKKRKRGMFKISNSKFPSTKSFCNSETDFHIFVRGGWINIWGGAVACFGWGVVAMPGKAKEKV